VPSIFISSSLLGKVTVDTPLKYAVTVSFRCVILLGVQEDPLAWVNCKSPEDKEWDNADGSFNSTFS